MLKPATMFVETCITHSFYLAPLWSFGPAAEENFTCFCHQYVSHARIQPWEARRRVYHWLSSTKICSEAEQLVRRQIPECGW